MTNLELVFRPFQSRDVTPPTIIPQEPKDVVTPVLLIGSESNKTFKLDVAATINVEVKDTTEYKATGFNTKTETVRNPDDPNQKVEVDRIEQVEFKDQAANPMVPKVTDKVRFDYQGFLRKQIGG